MKKWLLVITLCMPMLWSTTVAQSQEKSYNIMFYNLENLFDTINNNDKYDIEFSPQGAKKWNGVKYWKKQNNLDKILYDIAKQERTFPAIIGVSEIENRSVLEDLVAMPNLSRANYQIVHYDSPDRRGVDVALLYRPDQFEYEGSYAIPVTMPELPDFKTRDILSVWGKIDGERFYIFVMHWPSRLGGAAASEPKRMAAAQILRDVVDSVMMASPETKIAIMGDMNDDPRDKSMSETLGAQLKAKKVAAGELFNPFWEMHKKGIGTLAYRDSWSLFDNIIVNENLLNATTGELKLQKKNKYYGYIFSKPYMFQTDGQFKGYPLRTYVGSNFQDGFSDHLPVYILISK